MPIRNAKRLAGAGLLAAVVALSSAAAHAAGVRPEDQIRDTKEKAPRQLEGVGLTEKSGAQLPLDTPFVDENGKAVKLGDYFKTGLPVILTLNYSDCPMLCGVMLDALTRSIIEIPETDGIIKMALGQQFSMITVSLNPKETPKKASHTKAGYIQRFDKGLRPDAKNGWHFLTGKQKDIKAVADAVGFGYRHRVKEDDYLHPTVIMVLSSKGKVMRYINGIEYGPKLLTESLTSAGNATPQESAGFVLSCFHYEAKAGSYAAMGQHLMSYVAGAFAFLLFAAIAAWHFIKKKKARSGV